LKWLAIGGADLKVSLPRKKENHEIRQVPDFDAVRKCPGRSKAARALAWQFRTAPENRAA
jgi:hypothetical protein